MYLGLEKNSEYYIENCVFENIKSVKASLIYDTSACDSPLDRIIQAVELKNISISDSYALMYVDAKGCRFNLN